MHNKNSLNLKFIGLLFFASHALFANDQQPEKQGFQQPILAIELNYALTMPAGFTRVYFQQGEVMSYTNFDRYAVNCNLEGRNLADYDRLINPTSFSIKRIFQISEEVVLQAKSSQPHIQHTAFSDSGHSDIMRAINYDLTAKKWLRYFPLKLSWCFSISF